MALGKATISTDDAVEALLVDRLTANYILYKLNRTGWLKRVARGKYVLVPVDADDPDISVVDPWVIASDLFSPCYIGGWDAVSHWDLTDQIFNVTYVFTTKKLKKRINTHLGHKFIVQKVPESALLGLIKVWKDNKRILMSDPSRTVIDLMLNPVVYGGISIIRNVYKEYLESEEHKDFKLILHYLESMKNNAAYKRIGYLTEQLQPTETDFIRQCHDKMKKGKIRLDPGIKSPKLSTKWQLWLPSSKEKQ